jgi:hypothetical protein
LHIYIAITAYNVIKTPTTTKKESKYYRILTYEIIIGYLTVDKRVDWQRDTQGRIISGAISYAVDLINNDTNLLPNHHVNLIWFQYYMHMLMIQNVPHKELYKFCRQF